MKRPVAVVLGVLCLLLGGIKLVDWWTHRHLITLDAANAKIYPVLQEIARQAGVPVLARTNMTNLVTVHFHRVPVEEALTVLADQTDGRWEKVCLMARTASARSNLDRVLIEKGPPFLVTQMAMGGGMMFGNPAPASPSADTRFNLDFNGKTFQTAALQLALQARTPILTEEGFNPTLHLRLSAPDFPAAIRQLARAVQTRSELVYYFRVSQRGGNGMASRQDGGNRPSDPSEGREARWAEREQASQEQIALLSPEDQKKIRDLQAERLRRRAEWARLTPEERRKRLEAMATDPKFIDRMEKRDSDRIRNLTPEQMAARIQRFVSRHGPNQ